MLRRDMWVSTRENERVKEKETLSGLDLAICHSPCQDLWAASHYACDCVDEVGLFKCQVVVVASWCCKPITEQSIAKQPRRTQVLKTNSKWAVVHLGYGVKYTVLLAKWSKAVKLIPRLHAAVCKLAVWKLPEDSNSSEMHGVFK
ncbi:Importin Subunit Alpha-4 [Manis pentadactyla]|nr:Importin Subunit Alpha-4 [Manis pentadactyla]